MVFCMLAYLKLWLKTDNDTPVPNSDETETESDDEEEDNADDDNDESNPIIVYIVLYCNILNITLIYII